MLGKLSLGRSTPKDRGEIKCRAWSFIAPASGHLFREGRSVSSEPKGAILVCTEDPYRDKPLPAPPTSCGHLLPAHQITQSIESKRKERKHKQGFSVPLHTDSFPRLPSPHLRLALSLAELKAGLFPPRLSQINFLNCMKTENKQKTKSAKA